MPAFLIKKFGVNLTSKHPHPTLHPQKNIIYTKDSIARVS